MDNLTQTITLGQAFAHCFGTFSYWAWLIGVIVLGVACLVEITKVENKQNVDLENWRMVFVVFFAFALALAIASRPFQVHTTPLEWAKKGEYIGY